MDYVSPNKRYLMAIEIERKFLVKEDYCFGNNLKNEIIQGYLFANEKCATRIRISNNIATLNTKIDINGLSREEYEYEIPLDDGIAMLKHCINIIEKTRYTMDINNMIWEIDFFEGDNAGLVIAEVELTSENEEFKLPCFVSEEVTNDVRYYNTNLAENPFSKWK